MNRRKVTHLSVLLGIALITLFQYQNCAPPPAAISAGGDKALPVDTIDSVKKDSDVFFPQDHVQVLEDAAGVSLNGVCSQKQNGALLGWTLSDSASDQELAHGRVDCVMGGFQLDLEPAENLECGKQYKVTVRLGLGQPAVTTVARSCGG